MFIRVKKRKTQEYVTRGGKRPFSQWLIDLKDVKGRANILRRLSQAEEGNFGNYRSLNHGLFEFKIDFGPGFRVYFGLEGENIILLLCGGDKRTQERDITRAKLYWEDYQRR